MRLSIFSILSVLAGDVVAQEPLHKFLSYQNVSISCFEYGNSSDPTIILTGGWPWPSQRYAGYAQDLASDGFHVVRYDQRGAGESGHPTDDELYGIPNLAREFGTVIDYFAPGKPITVFGESWAPFIASEYSCTYPGRVKSLVSVGTPSFDLSWNSLLRATVNVKNDPSSLGDIVKQYAALSYFGFMEIPGAPEAIFNTTDIPAFVINAISDALQHPGQHLNLSTLGDYPTHERDYLPGSKKYKWLVQNRVLNGTKWSYLPVDNLRNFQLTSDPIETYLLDIDLDKYTPDLNETLLNGTHLAFDNGGNYQYLQETIEEYAWRAQE